LHVGNLKAGSTGFGDRALPAPQAGLMAALAQGIVGGEMTWPLVVTGAVLIRGETGLSGEVAGNSYNLFFLRHWSSRYIYNPVTTCLYASQSGDV
jgi:hypothetical protein